MQMSVIELSMAILSLPTDQTNRYVHPYGTINTASKV